jgi:hypothetical protein
MKVPCQSLHAGYRELSRIACPNSRGRYRCWSCTACGWGCGHAIYGEEFDSVNCSLCGREQEPSTACVRCGVPFLFTWPEPE